jgi:hypothetical protein
MEFCAFNFIFNFHFVENYEEKRAERKVFGGGFKNE